MISVMSLIVMTKSVPLGEPWGTARALFLGLY